MLEWSFSVSTSNPTAYVDSIQRQGYIRCRTIRQQFPAKIGRSFRNEPWLQPFAVITHRLWIELDHRILRPAHHRDARRFQSRHLFWRRRFQYRITRSSTRLDNCSETNPVFRPNGLEKFLTNILLPICLFIFHSTPLRFIHYSTLFSVETKGVTLLSPSFYLTWFLSHYLTHSLLFTLFLNSYWIWNIYYMFDQTSNCNTLTGVS